MCDKNLLLFDFINFPDLLIRVFFIITAVSIRRAFKKVSAVFRSLRPCLLVWESS